MLRRFFVVALAVVLGASASTVLAQCACGSVQLAYASAVPSYTAYYTPTVTYYAPETYVANYTPTSYVSYYPAATPQVAYYAPVTGPYTAYYAPVAQPYAAYYAPVAQPYVAYYGVAGWSMYGTPKVYVPGQPVRNVVRAVTP